MSNTSRLCEAGSRTPSMKVLPWLSNPRMNGRSPIGLPPSAAPKVMPGTVRSASASVVRSGLLDHRRRQHHHRSRRIRPRARSPWDPAIRPASRPVTTMSARWSWSSAGSADSGAAACAGALAMKPTQASARKAGAVEVLRRVTLGPLMCRGNRYCEAFSESTLMRVVRKIARVVPLSAHQPGPDRARQIGGRRRVDPRVVDRRDERAERQPARRRPPPRARARRSARG